MSRGVVVVIVLVVVAVIAATVVGWTLSRRSATDLSDPVAARTVAAQLIEQAGTDQAVSLHFSQDTLDVIFRTDGTTRRLAWNRQRITETTESATGEAFSVTNINWHNLGKELTSPATTAVRIDGQTGHVRAYRNTTDGAMTEIPLADLID